MTTNQDIPNLQQVLFGLLNPSLQQPNGIPSSSNGNGNNANDGIQQQVQLATNGLLQQLGGLLNQQQQQQQPQPQFPFGQVDFMSLLARQPTNGQQQQQQQQPPPQPPQQYCKPVSSAPAPVSNTTTAPPASTLKENEKAVLPSGIRMIPCRARRMPSSHNLMVRTTV